MTHSGTLEEELWQPNPWAVHQNLGAQKVLFCKNDLEENRPGSSSKTLEWLKKCKCMESKTKTRRKMAKEILKF